MRDAPLCCPMSAPTLVEGVCAATPACGLVAPSPMPRDGPERAVILALRFVAAAADTGDAACFDAAFDGAEAEFGSRDGPLIVARAAALLRAFRRDETGNRFLPPACRFLSPGETDLLGALRMRLSGPRPAAVDMSDALRAALYDVVGPMPPSRGAASVTLPSSAAARACHAVADMLRLSKTSLFTDLR